MRTRALLVAVLALLIPTTLLASEENAADFVKAVLAKVPATQEPCRSTPEGAGTGTAVTCGKASVDFDVFEEAWDKAVKETSGGNVAVSPVTPWQMQVGGWIRWYSIAEKWVVATYETKERVVTVTYSKDRDGVFSLVKGVVPPRRQPVLPARDATAAARGGLKPDAQGIVVLSAVVHSSGTVGNVEVLGCMPRHRGLEQAAVRAVKQWKYEPGKVDGTPVDVAMVATFTYGPGGSYRAAEGNEYKVSAPPSPFGLGSGPTSPN